MVPNVAKRQRQVVLPVETHSSRQKNPNHALAQILIDPVLTPGTSGPRRHDPSSFRSGVGGVLDTPGRLNRDKARQTVPTDPTTTHADARPTKPTCSCLPPPIEFAVRQHLLLVLAALTPCSTASDVVLPAFCLRTHHALYNAARARRTLF